MPSPPPRRRVRRVARILGAAAVLASAALLLGFGPADSLTSRWFAPFDQRSGDPDPADWPHEVLWLEAADGSRLEAWHFRVRGGEPPRGLVVHAHGNAGNLSRHWRGSAGLTDHGFEVLAFDYRGFGRSGGEVTRAAAREDLRTALAAARRLSPDRPVHVLGQSIGAALSLEVLAEERGRAGVASLVVDGPFDSWAGIAALHLSGDGTLRAPLDGLLSALLRRSGRDPVEAAADLGGLPLLVVYGTADRICPPDMARAVLAAAGERARAMPLPGAPHVGLRDEPTRAAVLAETAAFFRDAS